MSEDSINLNEISIVHWFKDLESHKCGYCKNPLGSISYGMWAETLTVEDYQNLIDRGWRRSGLYCYKPILDQTCCPQYTIRCEALHFTLSKSQKKVVKKLNKFLNDGLLHKTGQVKEDHSEENDAEMTDIISTEINYMPDEANCPKTTIDQNRIKYSLTSENREVPQESNEDSKVTPSRKDSLDSDQLPGSSREKNSPIKQKLPFKEGAGPDPDRPRCKKAKLLRLERKQKKLESQKDITEIPAKQNTNVAKSLEELLKEAAKDGKHKLRLELVPTSEPGEEWQRVENIEYELYKKYQTTVHNDKDLSLKGFKRFLVNSPLKPKPFRNTSRSTSVPGFGSYHQQYWLDDKLIAVGVIDILPKCISSVYFFYDPDYRSLTLGTYGSLRELQFIRELYSSVSSIQYYYMGFYIHSCPKMRYKGRLSPSYLLCPESYVWIPIEKCLPKLDASKYSRLNPDLDALDQGLCSAEDLDHIKVIVDCFCMFYKMYRKKYGHDQMFDTIGELVGKTALDMLFVVSD